MYMYNKNIDNNYTVHTSLTSNLRARGHLFGPDQNGCPVVVL